MPPKKKVVAYCRVSTLEQKKKGYGIDIQIRDVTRFAEREGLFVDRFYKDEGVSGTSEKRRGLRKLLTDCKKREIGTVIIPSLDRLSRDVRLAENLFWKFGKLNVQILIADMPSYDGKNRRDVLLRQIREAIAEDNRKDIIERLWKGRQERTRKGQLSGGTLPYGYCREGKRIRVDQDEAKVVKKIFLCGRRGLSRSEIADALNRSGSQRRNGKPWISRQVSSILGRRPLYESGDIQYGEVSGTNKSLILLDKVK